MSIKYIQLLGSVGKLCIFNPQKKNYDVISWFCFWKTGIIICGLISGWTAPSRQSQAQTLARRLLVRAIPLVYTIQGGDFIHVSQARKVVALGSVKKPGKVPVKENLTVSPALAHVEELDPLLASNNVAILRLNE